MAMVNRNQNTSGAQGTPAAPPANHGYRLRSTVTNTPNDSRSIGIDNLRQGNRQSEAESKQQALDRSRSRNNAQTQPSPVGNEAVREGEERKENAFTAPQEVPPTTKSVESGPSMTEEKNGAPQNAEVVRNTTQKQQDPYSPQQQQQGQNRQHSPQQEQKNGPSIHNQQHQSYGHLPYSYQYPSHTHPQHSQQGHHSYHSSNEEKRESQQMNIPPEWDRLYQYLMTAQLERYTTILFNQRIAPEQIRLLTRNDLIRMGIAYVGDQVKFQQLSEKKRQTRSDIAYLTAEKQSHTIIKSIPNDGRGVTIGALARLHKQSREEGNPELFITVMSNLRSHIKSNPYLEGMATTWDQAGRDPERFWTIMNCNSNVNSARIMIRKLLDTSQYGGLTKTALIAHITRMVRDIKSQVPISDEMMIQLVAIAIASVFRSQSQHLPVPKGVTKILSKQTVLDRMSGEVNPPELDEIILEIMTQPPFTIKGSTPPLKRMISRSSTSRSNYSSSRLNSSKSNFSRGTRTHQSSNSELFNHCVEKKLCYNHLQGNCRLGEQCKFTHASHPEKERLLKSFPSH